MTPLDALKPFYHVPTTVNHQLGVMDATNGELCSLRCVAISSQVHQNPLAARMLKPLSLGCSRAPFVDPGPCGCSVASSPSHSDSLHTSFLPPPQSKPTPIYDPLP
ncbi:unnamed protein product [Taenia asiatica]|uniref:Uncharacterized protein n=1 Tax=Taenia asiatica TaxID=60517 RepID=A0A0R3WG29_TAEAS|nr:unnamed protein product [Taenia asiatica]